MATKTEAPEERTHSPLFEAARKLMLASIGAAALAQEELQDLVNRLVDRGEIAEQEGKELMREIVEKRKERRVESRDRFTERVEEALDRMNVPSKNDIEALSAKITALSKKIDELKKSQS